MKARAGDVTGLLTPDHHPMRNSEYRANQEWKATPKWTERPQRKPGVTLGTVVKWMFILALSAVVVSEGSRVLL